eukprot:Opistho-1_new@19599
MAVVGARWRGSLAHVARLDGARGRAPVAVVSITVVASLGVRAQAIPARVGRAVRRAIRKACAAMKAALERTRARAPVPTRRVPVVALLAQRDHAIAAQLKARAIHARESPLDPARAVAAVPLDPIAVVALFSACRDAVAAERTDGKRCRRRVVAHRHPRLVHRSVPQPRRSTAHGRVVCPKPQRAVRIERHGRVGGEGALGRRRARDDVCSRRAWQARTYPGQRAAARHHSFVDAYATERREVQRGYFVLREHAPKEHKVVDAPVEPVPIVFPKARVRTEHVRQVRVQRRDARNVLLGDLLPGDVHS